MNGYQAENLRRGTWIVFDGTRGAVQSVLNGFIKVIWEDGITSKLPVDDCEEVELYKEKQ